MKADFAERAVLFALFSSMSFSLASVFFARYSRLVSSLWMNTLKALVCGAAILVYLAVTGIWLPVSLVPAVSLALSGAVGLGIGDLFLMSAFIRLGASRTLLIFGFQPLIMAAAGVLLFGQSLFFSQGVALVFFILCLVTLSLERYRREGRWEWKGLVFAFIGVLLDNGGVLLSKFSFEQAPELDPLQANLFRIGGALLIYALVSLTQPLNLLGGFRSLAPRDRALAIGASLLGTFLSLSFYLNALKFGHLAVISGIVLTGPLFSALLESAMQRKKPSPYQIVAFFCLVFGMSLVLIAKVP